MNNMNKTHKKYKSRDANMQGIAMLLRDSKSLEDFYAKMKVAYKDQYTLSKISYLWREKSKLLPRLIETRTEPATPKNGLKDAETYLSEILNEMRITNALLNEQLILFKRLETKSENPPK